MRNGGRSSTKYVAYRRQPSLGHRARMLAVRFEGLGLRHPTTRSEARARSSTRALDLGVNLIDTAEIYGTGTRRRIVGRAIVGRRDDVFVATKVFPVMPTVARRRAARPRSSAERLGVDVIDLYQVHWPNPVVPIGSQMDGMRRLQDSGIVHHVGREQLLARALGGGGSARWAAGAVEPGAVQPPLGEARRDARALRRSRTAGS